MLQSEQERKKEEQLEIAKIRFGHYQLKRLRKLQQISEAIEEMIK